MDCENNPVDPVFKFDRNTGKVLANVGKGVMVTPHGIHVDQQGNVAGPRDSECSQEGPQMRAFLAQE